jgi:hypothetical protein
MENQMNNFKKNRYSRTIALFAFLLFTFQIFTSVQAQDYLLLPGQESQDSLKTSFLDFDNISNLDSLEKIWRVEYAIYDSLYRVGAFDPPENFETPPDTMWQRLEKELIRVIDTDLSRTYWPTYKERFDAYSEILENEKNEGNELTAKTIYKMYQLGVANEREIPATLLREYIGNKSKFYPRLLLELTKGEWGPDYRNSPSGNLKKLRKIKPRPIELIEADYLELMYYGGEFSIKGNLKLADQKAEEIYNKTKDIYQLENQIDLLYVISERFDDILKHHDLMAKNRKSSGYVTWLVCAHELDKYYQATLKSIENYWPESVDFVSAFKGINPIEEEKLEYISNDKHRFRNIDQFEKDLESYLKSHNLEPQLIDRKQTFFNEYFSVATVLDSVVTNHIKPFNDNVIAYGAAKKSYAYGVTKKITSIETAGSTSRNMREYVLEGYQAMLDSLPVKGENFAGPINEEYDKEVLDFIYNLFADFYIFEADEKNDLYGAGKFEAGSGKEEILIALTYLDKIPKNRMSESGAAVIFKIAKLFKKLDDDESLLKSNQACNEILSNYPNSSYSYKALIQLGEIELAKRKPDLVHASDLFLQASNSPIFRKDLSALIMYCETQLTIGEAENVNAVREIIESELIENSSPNLWHDSERRRLIELLASTFMPPHIESNKERQKEIDNYLKEEFVRDDVYGSELQLSFSNLLISEINDLKSAGKILKTLLKKSKDDYLVPWIRLSEIKLNEQISGDLEKSFLEREKWIKEWLVFEKTKIYDFDMMPSTISSVKDPRVTTLILDEIEANFSIAKHLAIEKNDDVWAKRADSILKLVTYYDEKYSQYEHRMMLSNWQLKQHFPQLFSYPNSFIRIASAGFFIRDICSEKRELYLMAFNELFLLSEKSANDKSSSCKFPGTSLASICKSYSESFYDDPKTPSILYKSANICLKNNGYDSALNIYNMLLENYPNNEFEADAVRSKFYIQLRKRIYKAAITDADSIIASESYSQEIKTIAKSVLGQALFFQAKEEIGGLEKQSVRNKLYESVENIRDSEVVIPILQELAQSATTPEEAIDFYDLILELFPNSPQASRAVFNKAVILRGQRPTDEYDEDNLHENLAQLFERSSEIDSTSEYSLNYFLNAADEYSKANNLEKEIQMQLNIIRLFPDYNKISTIVDRALDISYKTKNIGALSKLRYQISENKLQEYLLIKANTLEGYYLWWYANNPQSETSQVRSDEEKMKKITASHKKEISNAKSRLNEAISIYEKLSIEDQKLIKYVAGQAKLGLAMIEVEEVYNKFWIENGSESSCEVVAQNIIESKAMELEQLLDSGGFLSYRSMKILALYNKRLADLKISISKDDGNTDEETVVEMEKQSLEKIRRYKRSFEYLEPAIELNNLLIAAIDSTKKQHPEGLPPYDYLGYESDKLIWNMREELDKASWHRRFYQLIPDGIIKDIISEYHNGVNRYNLSEFKESADYDSYLYKYSVYKEIVYPRFKIILNDIAPVLGDDVNLIARVFLTHDALAEKEIKNCIRTRKNFYQNVLEPELSKYENSVRTKGEEAVNETTQERLLNLRDLEADYNLLMIDFMKVMAKSLEEVLMDRHTFGMLVGNTTKRILDVDKTYLSRIHTTDGNSRGYKMVAEQEESTELQKVHYFFENMLNGYEDSRLSYLESVWELLDLGFDNMKLKRYLVYELFKLDPESYAKYLGLEKESYSIKSDNSWLVNTSKLSHLKRNALPYKKDKLKITADEKSDVSTYQKDFTTKGNSISAVAKITSSHPFELYVNEKFVLEVGKAELKTTEVFEVDLLDLLSGRNYENRIEIIQNSKRGKSIISFEMDVEYIKAPTRREEIIIDD